MVLLVKLLEAAILAGKAAVAGRVDDEDRLRASKGDGGPVVDYKGGGGERQSTSSSTPLVGGLCSRATYLAAELRKVERLALELSLEVVERLNLGRGRVGGRHGGGGDGEGCSEGRTEETGWRLGKQ